MFMLSYLSAFIVTRDVTSLRQEPFTRVTTDSQEDYSENGNVLENSRCNCFLAEGSTIDEVSCLLLYNLNTSINTNLPY